MSNRSNCGLCSCLAKHCQIMYCLVTETVACPRVSLTARLHALWNPLILSPRE